MINVFEAPEGISPDNAAIAISEDSQRVAFSSGENATLWQLSTGRVLDSWSLPEGLVDQIAFRDSGEIVLLRWDREESMVRVRRLAPGAAPQIVTEIPGFSRVHDAELAVREDAFAIRGLYKGTPSVIGFSLKNGRQRWARAGREKGGRIETDPTGALVLLQPPEGNGGLIVAFADGKGVDTVADFPTSLGPPQSKLFTVSGLLGPDVKLYARGQRTPLVNLGLNAASSWFPMFSPDGNLVAWGNADGSVWVCDLEEISDRLSSLGLAW